MPRVLTFYMDQISEHQRDLTNSASQRFIADYIAGFCLAVSRMTAVIRELGVDRERLLFNLRGGPGASGPGASGGIAGGVMAEPAYILLAESGVSEAHEVIRRITLRAEQEGCSFAQALAGEPSVLERIAGQMRRLGLIGPGTPEAGSAAALSFFERPESYRGLAEKKAQGLAEKYRKLMEAGEGRGLSPRE
jgi:adenylosuccinate lyase